MKNLLAIITTCLLMACTQHQVGQNIYQPKVLILLPNTKVQTKEGVYTSQNKDEIWYSQETIDNLEKKLSQF